MCALVTGVQTCALPIFHDFQSAHDGFVEADARIAGSVGILVGIGAVDAVDLGCFKDDLGTDLGTAQGCCGIGGKKRVARSGGEHHDLAFFEVRSEEHTSELQSLMRSSYAVFCLKKKKNKK